MGCKISVKVHPDEKLRKDPENAVKISPLVRFLKTLESSTPRLRGDLLVHPKRAFSVPPTPPRRAGAVCVGVDAYQHWPTLACASHDAGAVGHALKNLGFAVDVLTDTQATRRNIHAAIERCATTYDVFVVALFGHGTCPDGVGGMFVPVDALHDDSAHDKIHVSLLKTISKRSRATSGVFLLDFCFSGSFMCRTQTRSSWQERIRMEKARVVVTSGLSDERVDDDNGSGHSPFTSALLGSIKDMKGRNNGQGSIIELFVDVRSRIVNVGTTSAVPKLGRFPGCGGGDAFLNQLDKP